MSLPRSWTPFLLLGFLGCTTGPADEDLDGGLRRGLEAGLDSEPSEAGPPPDVSSDASTPDAADIGPWVERGDADPSDVGSQDAEHLEPVTSCPHPLEVDCATERAECLDQCAINCFSALPSAGVWDCTRLGTCVVVAHGENRQVAVCQGGGWGETCDDGFEGRCTGEVAVFCDRAEVRLATCQSADHCWFEGHRAGCRNELGRCSALGESCASGSTTGPCCNGLSCSGGTCRRSEGEACASGGECLIGLACRDEQGAPLPWGEAGRCTPPTCIAPGEFDVALGERCSDLPGLLCCVSAEMICDPGWDRCCFPGGASPLVQGSTTPSLCCSGRTDLSSEERCLPP